MSPLMLTDEEALAVLLGLVAGRRAGVVTTSEVATDSAAAKVRRVLPAALARRLDALLTTVEFTAPTRTVVEPRTAVLLLLAEAARDRRPVSFAYTVTDGHRTRRTVQPYGIVAHSGRWYVTGTDSATDEVRTFRLDRIADPVLHAGSFDVPEDFDPMAQVLSGIAEAPHRYTVSVRVDDSAARIRSRLPAGIATVADSPDIRGWAQVRRHAERLDWVPAVLVGLDAPFTIDTPAELQQLVRSLAARLRAAADGVPPAREEGTDRP